MNEEKLKENTVQGRAVVAEETITENREKIDILNRECFINRVLELTYKISENKGNMTFAINGDWGCGKTFVLNKIEERLENDENDKFLVIPYNCWQYDYYEEPLIAIVAALIDFKDSKNKISEETKKELKEIALNVGLGIATSFLKNKMGIDVSDIKDGLDKAKEGAENIRDFDNYYSFKKALSRLKKQLIKLSEQYTIVFTVDELDRCLPKYAIKVLERLHHITEDVPNMITLLAVDKKRLEHTVNSIFGDESAADYLKKFIKFEIALDNGIQDTQRFFDKFHRFCEKFDASIYNVLILKELNETKVDKFLETLFQGIGIRSKEQIIEKASIVHDLCFGNKKLDYTVMYMELFYAVLWYHYKAKSIFDNNHAVSRGEFIFEKYKDIPKHFNDSWGFIPAAYINSQDPRRINIDSSDILLIIFYYWFHVKNTRLRPDIPNNELYPEVEVKMELFFRENLKKLENFLDSLALID